MLNTFQSSVKFLPIMLFRETVCQIRVNVITDKVCQCRPHFIRLCESRHTTRITIIPANQVTKFIHSANRRRILEQSDITSGLRVEAFGL